jgi:hypothetical protein
MNLILSIMIGVFSSIIFLGLIWTTLTIISRIVFDLNILTGENNVRE